MAVPLKQRIATRKWKATFPEEGSYDYILEHTVAEGGNRHHFTRNVNVDIREPLYGGFSRSVAVKTRSLNFKMDGPAAGNARLARQLAGAYDLLWLEVTHEGVILKIKNIQQVRDRWKAIKEQVQLEYNGDEVDQMLADIDETVTDEQHIIREIQQYNFLGLLFGGFYQDCSNRSQSSRERPIRYLSEPVTVTEQQWLEGADEEHNTVTFGIGAGLPKNSPVKEYTGQLTFNTETDWMARAQLKITEQQTEHAFLLTQIQD
jgi:hypothetical protein